MVKLSKEAVMKDESVNFVRAPVRRDLEKRSSLVNVVCFSCQEKGHLVYRCLKKKPATTVADVVMNCHEYSTNITE